MYKAKHQLTNESYAIKFFHKSFELNSELDFIYKEIDSLKVLSHPYIIKLYNYCIYNDKLVIILEYASGGSLKSKKH